MRQKTTFFIFAAAKESFNIKKIWQKNLST
jgi:hypothetical protein